MNALENISTRLSVRLKHLVMPWIFFQSLVASLWSLYLWYFGDPVSNYIWRTMFDTSLWYPPCDLCWFARILMYPLVFLTLIALIRKEKTIFPYLILPVVLWLGLEVFHYTIQKINTWLDISCSSANPCDGMYVDYMWFMTIPFLCLLAFTVIALFLCIHYSKKKALTIWAWILIMLIWILALVGFVSEYLLFVS